MESARDLLIGPPPRSPLAILMKWSVYMHKPKGSSLAQFRKKGTAPVPEEQF